MSATDPGSGDLLGDKATAIIYAIANDAERERVLRAILTCDDALEVVDALDLAPYEMVEAGTSDLGVWEALAPDVRNLLVAVRTASERLATLFPVEASVTGSLDLDFTFDLGEDGAPAPIRDKREEQVDVIVTASRTEDLVGASIASLAAMLQHDFVQFGQRLRSPNVMTDRWFLLGELQEMRGKCTQCLEAVVATVLGAYTSADLATILPRYATAARRAIKLRTMIVDLSHDVNRLNMAVRSADAAKATTIRNALSMRLNEVAENVGYQFLRPLDKRALIDFRQRFQVPADPATGPLAFRRDVEGLSKFLEVMRAINQRGVLVENDRRKLQTARMLLESEVELEEVQPILEDVYGRWHALDDFVRIGRRGRSVPPEDILQFVLEAQESLRGG